MLPPELKAWKMPPEDHPITLSRRLRFGLSALRRTAGAWALAGWAAAGAIWDGLGRYDLALSQLMSSETAAKFPRAYQGLAMLSAWLSSWVFWTIGGLVIAFAAAVEWGVRAEMRGERNAEAKRKAAIAARHTIPPDAPVAILADKAARLVDALTQSPKPKPAPIVMPPDPEPEWDRLYGVSEDGHDVRLLILPDGEDVEGHALLLVLYGHRIKFGRNRVPVQVAAKETLRALHEAPNAAVAARMMSIMLTARGLEPEKVGVQALARGEVERVGLSKGGQYEITEHGLMRADDLVRDLIRRA